jgi:hypothetical protein
MRCAGAICGTPEKWHYEGSVCLALRLASKPAAITKYGVAKWAKRINEEARPRGEDRASSILRHRLRVGRTFRADSYSYNSNCGKLFHEQAMPPLRQPTCGHRSLRRAVARLHSLQSLGAQRQQLLQGAERKGYCGFTENIQAALGTRKPEMSSSETENSERRFPPPGTGACLRLFPREHGRRAHCQRTHRGQGDRPRRRVESAEYALCTFLA